MRIARRPSILFAMLLVGCDAPTAATLAARVVRFSADTVPMIYFGRATTRFEADLSARYARILRSVGEPALRNATLPERTSVLRFFWLRSFHDIVTVRVVRSPSACLVVTTARSPDVILIPDVVSTGRWNAGMQSPVTITRRDSTVVPNSSCAGLDAHLDALGLATNRRRTSGRGFDGADWVFERVDASGHAWRQQWSPSITQERTTWDAGMAFLVLARSLPSTAEELY